MKIRVVHILIIIATVGVGAVLLNQPPPPDPVVPEQEPVEEIIELKPEVRPIPPVAPNPVIQEKVAPTPPPPEPKKKKTANTRRVNTRYWERAALQFERQWQALYDEADPNRRLNLIQTMARNVRIDTPGTLDWAMSLTDPAEMRAALEAINENALVGIGAHIRVDETGLPKIMDTTALSAIASTGMSEPGDYISGMVQPDGSTISFKGMPIQQIVQYLRGEPGTEIRLFMEREATGDNEQPYSYDVPIQRSMIVVQPPY